MWRSDRENWTPFCHFLEKIGYENTKVKLILSEINWNFGKTDYVIHRANVFQKFCFEMTNINSKTITFNFDQVNLNENQKLFLKEILINFTWSHSFDIQEIDFESFKAFIGICCIFEDFNKIGHSFFNKFFKPFLSTKHNNENKNEENEKKMKKMKRK